MSNSDTPTWIEGHPLIMTGSWDYTPIFRLRRGTNGPDDEAQYRQRYFAAGPGLPPITPAAMKALGVNLAVVDFFKAFGLAAEREYADGLRDFVQACKANGIRIGAYVGSTLAYETMEVERPESKEWLVESPSGGYLYYPGESFRARLYFPHPGYRAYIKEVLTAAITEFGAEEIHFDSASVMAEQPIFYHPQGVIDFRNFLASRYDDQGLKQRFGLSSVAAVLPPRGSMSPVYDPMLQEWAEFRCQALVDYFAEMRAHIKALNPEVAISVNTVAIATITNIEMGGVDHGRLLPLVDILWNEEYTLASVNSGVMASQIRAYKAVAGMGKRMFAYAGDSTLQLAEAMAYNRETLGMLGEPLATLQYPADRKAFLDFYRLNFVQGYRGFTSAAEVAILHSFATMAFGSSRARQSSLLFQQALIQGQIPFDLLFDEGLQRLSSYRVLVLSCVENLSDGQLQLIRDFVASGGALVATEFTSLYNQHRQRQSHFGLHDLFGGLPLPQSSGGVDVPLRMAIVHRTFGNGRVIYVPDVVATENLYSPSARLYPLPANAEELIQQVRLAAGLPLSLQLIAPNFVTTELTRSADGSVLVVHLVNYNHPNTQTSIQLIQVQLRIPAGRQVSFVTWHSPADPIPVPLSFVMASEVMQCAVPSLGTYGFVRIGLA